MRYVDESHVACDVTAGESAKLLGFASASYSQNDGADWTHLDRSDNLATVNWATAPVTRRAIAPFPPAGIPVTLQGENMVPDVHVARVGCAFDGGPPADGGDASQLSSTLTRCEPPQTTGRPTVRVAVEPLGTRGAGGMDASPPSWTPTPWVIPTRVSTGVGDDFDEGSGSAAAAEGGGGSVTVEVSVWDDARAGDGGGVDADAARERFEASSGALGCRFGTVRVASRPTRSQPRGSGQSGAATSEGSVQSGAATSDVPPPIDRALVSHGALECVAPALVAGRTVALAAGATHAELPTRSGLIVVGDSSSRSGGSGVAAPGPMTALAGARSSGSATVDGETVVLLVGSFAPSRGLALECGVAGRGFEHSSDASSGSSGRSSGSDSGNHGDRLDDSHVDSHRIGYACTPGAIPRGGFHRLAAWPASAAVKAGDRWSASPTSWFDGVQSIGVELRVVEEPVVLSHHPVAIAVGGDGHANVPLTIVGVNLPGGGPARAAVTRAAVRRLRTLTRGAWVTSGPAANAANAYARPSPPSPSRSPPR